MNGLKRNTERLFSRNGKLFLMAMDLPQSGMVQGLEKPRELLHILEDTAVDGFVTNIGLADEFAQGGLLRKKLVLRSSSGGSMLGSEYTTVNTNHVSPETALACGADAVLMMCVVGGRDYAALQRMAEDIDAFHRLQIPVIAEVLCADYDKTASLEVQLNGARIAAELGADVVKGFYTEQFDRVVGCCPVPFLLAGGAVNEHFLTTAREALRCGVRGFAFGRNVFQSKDPAEKIRRIAGLLDQEPLEEEQNERAGL